MANYLYRYIMGCLKNASFTFSGVRLRFTSARFDLKGRTMPVGLACLSTGIVRRAL